MKVFQKLVLILQEKQRVEAQLIRLLRVEYSHTIKWDGDIYNMSEAKSIFLSVKKTVSTDGINTSTEW